MKKDDTSTRKQIKLLEERFEKKHKKPFPKDLCELRVQTPVDKRRRRWQKRNLSLSEKIMICHMVICRELAQDDVAREFRVTQQCISHTVCQARKNPKILKEIMMRKEEVERDKRVVQAVLEGMKSSNTFVDSVDMVRDKII